MTSGSGQYASNGNTGTSNSTAESAPTIRADGTLTYVPSMGTNKKGLLVAIGGGQNYVSNDQNSASRFLSSGRRC